MGRRTKSSTTRNERDVQVCEFKAEWRRMRSSFYITFPASDQAGTGAGGGGRGRGRGRGRCRCRGAVTQPRPRPGSQSRSLYRCRSHRLPNTASTNKGMGCTADRKRSGATVGTGRMSHGVRWSSQAATVGCG